MAAPMPQNLKIISSLGREQGRDILREELGWKPFVDEDEPQRSIHLDCLFDNLMFMVNKGFQWNEIAVLFKLIQELLEDCKGYSVNEVVKYFSIKLQSVSESISEATAKKFSEFFFTTYMRHFKLYQFVFSQSQEKLIVDTDVTVSTPPLPVPPFSDAKDLDVYDYEKKYQELETEEETKLQEHEKRLEELKLQAEENIKKTVESLGDSPLNREELVKLIHEVASAHIIAASSSISTEISNKMEDLDIMLEKTALPRPHALGQPPRYKTKTPIPSSPSKARQVTSRDTVKSKSRQSSRTGKR